MWHIGEYQKEYAGRLLRRRCECRRVMAVLAGAAEMMVLATVTVAMKSHQINIYNPTAKLGGWSKREVQTTS